MKQPQPYGIRQDDLRAYLRLEANRKAMEATAREIAKKEKALAGQLLTLLKKRLSLEPGEFTARIGRAKGRAKWKEAFVSRLGEAAARKVEAAVRSHQVLVVELSEKESQSHVA